MFNSNSSSLKKSKTLVFSSVFLFVVIFCAFFSSLIANDQPILVKDSAGLHAPAFAEFFSLSSENISNEDWNNDTVDFAIYPLIKWKAGKSDYNNSDYVNPFDKQFTKNRKEEIVALSLRDRHWLGTDLRGTDVLSGIIHGARISLAAGFFSAILAVIIGLIVGGIAAWMGNSGFTINRAHLICIVIAAFPVFHMIINPDLPLVGSAIFIVMWSAVLFFSAWIAGNFLSRYSFLSKKVRIPFDYIILRIIEIFTTFPKIVLILVMAAFSTPSFSSLVFLLVITGWADFARLARGEFLRISNYAYIDAARLSGAGNFRIILKHALPNMIAPLLVTFVYAVASYILIEAGLSFLGVGVPADQVTWGSLLASGKDNLSAWWLILFPGLVLSLTIACFHRIAEEIKEYFL